MKILIFAGGSGRRLWPISRKSSPKQFEPLVGDRSTIQLAVERVKDAYGIENVVVSTNKNYVPILRDQLPGLPKDNLIGEPVRRDLAAAVGLSMTHVYRNNGPDEVVAIIWGDNYMTKSETFLEMLDSAESIVGQGKARIAFMGETARFPNNNLGWIELGEKIGQSRGLPYYEFKSWHYRPSIEHCQEMFTAGNFVWNTGYFATTAGYIIEAYRKYQPAIWEKLDEIGKAIGQPDYESTLSNTYPSIKVESFDDAIVKQLPNNDAAVLHGTMGWSDPGTLYALKESIDPDQSSNVELGLVQSFESKDCLLYNYEDEKLMAAVGLDGMIVVNTDDALLVVNKDDIHLVKEFVDGLINTGLESYS